MAQDEVLRVGRYRLEEQIFAGRSAVLYRGVREDDGARVTAKLLSGEYPDEGDVARIRHEYTVLKDLDLPGVVKALDLVKHRNALALVIADEGGRALIDVMREGRLDVGTVLRLGISLAGTIGELHKRNIIHKDIKPHNLLVDAGRTRITLFDFGVATHLSQQAERAFAPQALEGTLAYISPEQTGRMNRLVDSRTDLYAIGVTLYEMLTGALPFSALDPMELVHSHIARAPTPPHERAPEVPETLSRVVMKLLSKAAEDRYQRAEALRVDLEKCLRAWESTGTIAVFPVGAADVRDRVRIPQRLFEREAELASLSAAFARTAAGAAELFLVRGGAGVGKSALAHEIRTASAARGGYFLAGKCDSQRGQGAPYAAVARAFGDLAPQILAQRAEISAGLTKALGDAVRPNGQALTEIVPELAPILGPQPPVAPLGPVEAQNRLTMALGRALRVLATAEHPLAIFLDDLQWADPASLKLLQALLTDPERGHLLVIGAYRDGEVNETHPLAIARGEIERLGGAVSEVALSPLSEAGALALVAEALGCSDERAAPLARLLHARAQGNPFFIGRLLTALEADRLIAFDADEGALSWDVADVRERLDTDDVLVFLTRRLRRLGEDAQRLIATAACIGVEFDLATLSAVDESEPRAIAEGVWEALSEGVIVRLDAGYGLIEALRGIPGEAVSSVRLRGAYGFPHDRMHQAAYALFSERERRAVHLRVGRYLRDGALLDARSGALFEVVRHLNEAAELITDPGERIELAWTDLAAGKRARAMMASAAAADVLAIGASLLPKDGFQSHYELAFGLHLAWAECAYLSGQPERAEALFDELLVRARSVAERAEIRSLRATLYLGAGKPAEALREGLAGLALFEGRRVDRAAAAPLPALDDEDGWRAALSEQAALVDTNLAGRAIGELVDAPALTTPEDKALLRLLMNIYVPGWVVSTTIGFYLLTKLVNECLSRGHSEVAPFAYGTYGFLLAGAYGRYRQSYELGELSLALSEKFPSPELLCKLYLNTGVPLLFSRPFRVALARLERAVQAGFSSGDLTYLSYAVNNALMIRLGIGDDLAEVLAQADKGLTLLVRTGDVMSHRMVRLSRQMAACLLGRTRDPASLSDDAFDEETFSTELVAAGLNVHVYYYHLLRGQAALLQADHGAAFEHVLAADKLVGYSAGLYLMTELPLLACLTAAALCASAAADDRARYEAMIAAQREKLAGFAEGCAENFRHKLLLVDAELARIRGDDSSATDAYERAVIAARDSGVGRDEALANELAGRYHLGKGRPKIARTYMTDAYYGYLQWGAATKVAALAAAYPTLIVETTRAARTTTDTVTAFVRTSSHTSSANASDALDLGVVMNAAHALSSEIVLDKVLDRMMRILAESAGAQRGVLLLDHDGTLAVEAAISFGPDVVAIGPAARAAGVARYSGAIVDHVASSGRTLVLDDARVSASFAGDAYVAAHRPRSVLCIALSHQGRRTGIVYLENGAAAGVFTPTRVELSSLLGYQAAIAVENARLYAHVQAVTDELRRSNEVLEENVQRRTEQLREANAQLTVELTERARAEQARAALQEQVIQAQSERLVELSTPMIPITEHVMVMPLIGTLDVGRAAQMHETALRGAAEARARMVILDITGIRAMDRAVADTLMRTVAALRLVGTRAAITGVRPDVAQTLVSIGAQLSSVLTFGTLRGGIAYALKSSVGARR